MFTNWVYSEYILISAELFSYKHGVLSVYTPWHLDYVLNISWLLTHVICITVFLHDSLGQKQILQWLNDFSVVQNPIIQHCSIKYYYRKSTQSSFATVAVVHTKSWHNINRRYWWHLFRKRFLHTLQFGCAQFFIFTVLTTSDHQLHIYTPAQRSWRGVYWIHLVHPSVSPSFGPSVCRQHGFRSQVCFGISISYFICMLMVAISRSL